MLLPQNPHYFTREIKTKSTKPYNPIKHLNVSFWALGHWTHRSFHTPEFYSLPSTAQKKKGRVMDCSSCSWGNVHICEELCSFRVFEMSHHRSLVQLQVHSKPEGLKQKMCTPQDRPHSLWTPTGSSTTRAKYKYSLSFEVPCPRHRRTGVRLPSWSWTSAQVYLSSLRI